MTFSLLMCIRHQVNHFVSTLQQYVLSQLSDVSWCRFCFSLKHEVWVCAIKYTLFLSGVFVYVSCLLVPFYTVSYILAIQYSSTPTHPHPPEKKNLFFPSSLCLHCHMRCMSASDKRSDMWTVKRKFIKVFLSDLLDVRTFFSMKLI